MDVVYLYQYSASGDFEIRYSLRSIAAHAPYIRKVWIFGDRPHFLSDDRSIVEHVPHEALAPLLGVRTPVRNFFLLMVLSSLIPELDFEYLRFSDDYFLLQDLPIESARTIRYLEDLAQNLPRRKGVWSDCLWRTYDFLLQQGYTGLNYETHVPFHLTKRRVMDAFLTFRSCVTEDPYAGLMGATAILNHAVRHEGLSPVSLQDEQSRLGYWYTPPTFEEVIEQSTGHTFLNFSERAFGPGLRQFLEWRFPVASRFEGG